MGTPIIDDSGWPILAITYPPIVTPEEAELHYEELTTYLQRSQPFGVLIDARPADVPNAPERARIAAFLRETAHLSARTVVGVALVMKTTVGRGVMTAVLWLFTPPFPVQHVTSICEGRQWLEERLMPPPREGTGPRTPVPARSSTPPPRGGVGSIPPPPSTPPPPRVARSIPPRSR